MYILKENNQKNLNKKIMKATESLTIRAGSGSKFVCHFLSICHQSFKKRKYDFNTRLCLKKKTGF
jgi:hypothetical protein